MGERQRCSQRVQGTGWGNPVQCSRNATTTHEGKPYCGQHDPAAIARRRAVQTDRWRAESAELQRKHLRETLARDLAALAVKEPETFPPNAQPIVAKLLELSRPAAPAPHTL